MRTVDLIVPQYNLGEMTEGLFRSLAEYRPKTARLRVILVDNGSDPAELSRAIAAADGLELDVIRNEENLGFVKATNQGIRFAMERGADFVCLQNNDTVVEADWLDKMLAVFDLRAKAGLVGPTTVIAESWQNRKRCTKRWGPPEGWPPFRRIGGMLAFFCVVIRREVIEQVGLLDEDYGIGFGDDDDYCERVRRSRWELFLRCDVTIPHLHRTTFNRFIPGWQELAAANLELFKSRWGP